MDPRKSFFLAFLAFGSVYCTLCNAAAEEEESSLSNAIDRQGNALCESVDKLRESLERKPGQDLRLLLTLQEKVTALEERLEAMKVAADENVFFNAMMTETVSCYNCNVNFNVLLADSHNAFNAERGIFTAPVTGHYLLQFHALAHSGSEAQVELVVNGIEEVAHLYDRDTAGSNMRFAMIGQAVVKALDAGDVVGVRLHKGSLKSGESATYTSFLGVKLSSTQQQAEAQNEI